MQAAVVVALLLVPSGSGLATSVGIEVHRFPDPMAPGGPAVGVPADLEVSCPSSESGSPAMRLTLSLGTDESWLAGTVDPNRFEVPPDECREEPWEANGTVSVNLSTQAPAFVATRVPVRAHLEAADGNHTAADTAVVTPGYHGAANVAFADSNVTVDPENLTTAILHVENHGNGETRFEFGLAGDGAPGRLDPRIVLPEPTVLRSAATGAETTEEAIPVRILPPAANVTEPRGHSVEVRVTSFYAGHPSTGMTNRTVELDLWLVPSKAANASAGPEDGRSLPGPGAAGVAVAVVVVGLSLRRRRSR